MALQEVLEFLCLFMYLQSEKLPVYREVLMIIFLQNKVHNPDIYPDP